MKFKIIHIPLLILVSAALSAEVQESPLLFYHESFGTGQLDTLLDLYDYDEHVETGSGEFDKMVMLKDWVYSNVEYGGALQYIDLRDSLTILQKAFDGEVFWCNNIAAVYMQCGLSLGWTPRYMFLRNTKFESHIANDIWSNEYKKWVFIDATWNIHVLKEMTPLSLLEIKAEWLKNNGADLTYVFGAGENSIEYSAEELPIKRDDNFLYRLWPVTDEWISFFYEVAILGMNNLFSRGNIWQTIYIIKDSLNEDDYSWEFRRKIDIDDMKLLFHDLNRVDIETEYLNRHPLSNFHKITLDAFGPGNFTPNLESYLISINGSGWERSGKTVSRRLNIGRNIIRSKIINKFGVEGPVTKLEYYFWP